VHHLDEVAGAVRAPPRVVHGGVRLGGDRLSTGSSRSKASFLPPGISEGPEEPDNIAKRRNTMTTEGEEKPAAVEVLLAPHWVSLC